MVYEFFVAHAFRGTNVAKDAVGLGLDLHPGRWEVVTWPKAKRPQAFWRRVLPQFALEGVQETEGEHPFGERVMWRFASRVRKLLKWCLTPVK